MTRRELGVLLAQPLLSPQTSAAPAWVERAPMPLARAGCMAANYGNKVLVAGGSHWESDKKVFSDRCDLFDPRANLWSQVAPLPTPRSDAACATTDSVHILGGIENGTLTDSALSFDGRRWVPLPEARLPFPTTYATALAIGQDIYLFGGLNALGDITTATNTLYRRRSGEPWIPLAPLPSFGRVTAAVVLHRKRIYVLGGMRKDPARDIENLAEVWAYNPATNIWTQCPPLPFASRAGSAVSVGREILYLGGYTDGFSTEIHVYDPATGTTSSAGNLPHPLADSRFVRIGARCIGVGGETGVKIRAPWTLETKLPKERG